MEKYRAIPHGYMTVGEIAKKMGMTVRTLQYYDKEGIFSPSTESDGGRRLYTAKDVFKLHQIQSMKYLGFSLKDIKDRLPTINTPNEVAALLTEQAKGIRKEIKSLKEVLSTTEKLKDEITKMESVDWQRYADIVLNLQMGNEYYGMIKHIDDDVIEDLSGRMTKDEAQKIINSINSLMNTVIQYIKDGVSPESEKGQILAKEFWDKALEASGGDIEMLAKISEKAELSADFSEKQRSANEFIEPALMAYFAQHNYNPFEQEGNENND